MKRFDVRTTADLQRLRSEYMQLCSSGFAGRVDIRVAPDAKIGLTGWGLEPEMRASKDVPIDIVVDGGGGALPMFGTIVARSVRLQNVVLTDGGRAHIWVTRELAMQHVMIVDARAVAESSDVGTRGPGLLSTYANGGAVAAVNVTIEDSWFVRNFQDAQPDQLVWLTSAGERAGTFGEIRVARTAFLGNAFAADLAIERAARVVIDDSLFFRSWAGPGSELACGQCGSVEISGSSFVLERGDQRVAVTETPPVQVRESRVVQRSSFASDAAVAEAITALGAAPRRVPAADTWTRLRALFPR